MTLEEILEPDQRVYNFIDEIKDKYIFVDVKNELAYCTACKEEYSIKDTSQCYKHNSEGYCISCQKTGTIKYTKYGHKTLMCQRNILTFKKDPNGELIGVGYYFEIRFKDFKNPSIWIKPEAYYIFGKEKNKMFRRNYKDDYVETGSLYRFNQNWLERYDLYIDYKQFDILCENTKFSYINNEYINIEAEPVKFLDLYTKYPLLEKMIKMHLYELVEEKLRGNTGVFSFKDKNKSVYEALKITKGEYRYITKYIVEPEHLKSSELNTIKHLKDVCNIKNITEFKPEVIKFFVKYVLNPDRLKAIKMDINQYYKYYIKQMNKNNNIGYYGLATMYDDYIRFLKELKIKITDKNIAPEDLKREHDIYSKMVKLINSEKQNKKIEEQLDKLNAYIYDNDSYFIRPIANIEELIKEGEEMHHCVATYAGRYADGKTSIFVVRSKKDPLKPLVTVEIDLKGKRIVQNRAKHNAVPSWDIKNFLNEFYDNKLAVKKKNRRKKVA